MKQTEDQPHANADAITSRLGGVEWLIIASGVITRWVLYVLGLCPVDGDETIVGLMAYDLQNATRLPVYFYKQHYMGALEVPPVALLQLFGPEAWKFSMWPIRLSQTGFFVLLCVIHFRLTARFFGPAAGRWALFFLSYAPFYWMDYSFRLRHVTLMMAVGEGLMLLVLRMTDLWRSDRRVNSPTLMTIGIIAGLGWWHYQLISVYIAPLLVILLLYSSFVPDTLRRIPDGPGGGRPESGSFSIPLMCGTGVMVPSVGLLAWLSFGDWGRHFWEVSQNRYYTWVVSGALAAFAAGAAPAIVLHHRTRTSESLHKLAAVILGAGFLIGYAPAIVYYLILDEEFWVSGVRWNLFDIPGRLRALFILDFSAMLEITVPSREEGHLRHTVATRTWCAFGIYFLSAYVLIRRTLAPRSSRERVGSVYFLALFLFLVALHIVTPRATDWISPRFLVPAFSVTSVTLGLAAEVILRLTGQSANRRRVGSAAIVCGALLLWGPLWVDRPREAIRWPSGHREEAMSISDELIERGVQRVWLDWGTSRVLFGYELQYISRLKLRVNQGLMGDRLNGYVDETRWEAGDNYFMTFAPRGGEWKRNKMMSGLEADRPDEVGGSFFIGNYFVFPFPDDWRNRLPR